MLELYTDKPFALVGVNSDDKLEVAKKGKLDSRLPYRTWWDGYAEKNTEGPIAKAWGVTGWPTKTPPELARNPTPVGANQNRPRARRPRSGPPRSG